MSNRKCDHWLKLRSTMYSWLNFLSSSNISLHRCSLLASLLNQVNLLACVIVLVLALACWMELASARTRECTRA